MLHTYMKYTMSYISHAYLCRCRSDCAWSENLERFPITNTTQTRRTNCKRTSQNQCDTTQYCAFVCSVNISCSPLNSTYRIITRPNTIWARTTTRLGWRSKIKHDHIALPHTHKTIRQTDSRFSVDFVDRAPCYEGAIIANCMFSYWVTLTMMTTGNK